jgi:hypothetical protein
MEYHVATTGADDNPGTQEKPFATLERARDAIRVARCEAGAAWRGATVWLAGGFYERRQSFELTAEDSGTADAPVVYRALPGATARLVGGVRVPTFTKTTDPVVLGRLHDYARAFIWEADLSGLGITDYGALRSRGFNRHEDNAHMELFSTASP